MKINGWFIGVGILLSMDYLFNLTINGYNFGLIQIFNCIMVILLFGLAFNNKESKGGKNEKTK